MWRPQHASALAVVLSLAQLSWAGDNGPSRTALAKRGKAATALVEVRGTGPFNAFGQIYASAFCIHSTGLFLTNEHALHGPGMFPPNQAPSTSVTLVLHPGLKTERSYRAEVVRTDKDKDLALLRVAEVQDLPVLQLGSDKNLEELADVIAFGFPFGNAPVLRSGNYPEISVNPGSITALRHDKNGELSHIQFDGAMNPGNSGGPVLDKDGKVVGMVVSRVQGSQGVNFAIPVSVIEPFVARPDVQFDIPRLNAANIYGPVTFETRVVPILPSKELLAAELIVKTPAGPEQVHRMKRTGSRLGVTFTPFQAPSGPRAVRLQADFANGSINGTLTDQSVHVGERELKLSEVRDMTLGREASITLHGGQVVHGAASGLEALPIRLGEQTLTINLAGARELRFAPAIDVDQLWCTLVVHQGSREIFRESEALLIDGMLPLPVAGDTTDGIRAPRLEAGRVERRLPADVRDMCVGGAGRYLVLDLPRLNELAIFDVNAAAVVGHIPMKDAEGLFAAGLEHLIIVHPSSRTVERWNLKTRRREVSSDLPTQGTVQSIAMGSASRGPLLLRLAGNASPQSRSAFELLTIDTMKVVEGTIHGDNMMMGILWNNRLHIRAAANGKVFGMWSFNTFPSGLGTIVVSDAGAQGYYAHLSVGYVVPGPDGKIIFTQSGMFAPQVQHGVQDIGGETVLPACQGKSYLVVPQLQRPGPVYRPAPGRPVRTPQEPPATVKPAHVLVRELGHSRPVATLTNIDLTVPTETQLTNDFTCDKRVHFIPAARLIITIPPTNDRLVLYRLEHD